jgi:hypothetical protein
MRQLPLTSVGADSVSPGALLSPQEVSTVGRDVVPKFGCVRSHIYSCKSSSRVYKNINLATRCGCICRVA